MEKSKVMLAALYIAIAASGLFMIYGAVYDGFVLGISIAAAFILAVYVFAYHLRISKLNKIYNADGHLIYWEYAPEETENVIAHELASLKKGIKAVAILVFVCLIIIALPFVILSMQKNPFSPMLIIAVVVVSMPLIAIKITPLSIAAAMRKAPCTTVIGRDHILNANRYLGINDYYLLNLEQALLIEPGQYGMYFLRLTYSYRAMKSPATIRKTVDVAVPLGRENEAEKFCAEFVKQPPAKSGK